MNFTRKYLFIILGVITGAGLGFIYWWFVGCALGTCPIFSSPLNSTLYGALLGGLLFDIFRKNKVDALSD